MNITTTIKRTLLLTLILLIMICGIPMMETALTIGEASEASPASDMMTSAFATYAYGDSDTASDADLEARAQAILDDMSLKDKIGQLFMVSPDAIKGSGSSVRKLTPEMKKLIKKYRLGGIIMFDRNISSPKQIKSFNKALTNASYDYSGLPLFIAVDEEGGRVTRIAHKSAFDVKKYKSMLKIGKTKDPSRAESVGRTIGKYLDKYGFTLDLAPVADCFTNKKNKVIGDRSFGSDPDLVSSMVSAEIDGLHKYGIMTAIKHYPGHGNTKSDTHTQSVKVTKSWKKLKKLELIPFVENMDDTDMIMASHIRCTGVSKTIAPTSISKTMIQKKLRDELGYDGVVITDGMGMAAISDKYNSAEAAVRAINAGCDIVLCPVSLKNAYNGVRDAVRSGKITEERLNESVLRIIKLKLKYAEEN